ncbi:MAG TPA: hypothetical protein VF950_07575 [Planctomycetota bacterium]
MRVWTIAALALAGCDPAPLPPAAPAPVKGDVELTGKVKYAKTGQIHEYAWTLLEGDFGEPLRRTPAAGFQGTRDVCEIQITRTEPPKDGLMRSVSLVYRLVSDGKSFVLLKGGHPYHAVEAQVEEKAVAEALDFGKAETARTLFGGGAR